MQSDDAAPLEQAPAEEAPVETPAGAQQEAQPQSLAADPTDTALFDGPTPILWSGALTIMFVMLLAFFLLMRGRAARARKAPPNTDFFQPAGEHATITFEDEQAQSTQDAPIADEALSVNDGHPLAEVEQEPLFEPDVEAQPAKSRSPFAGLFSRKKPKQEAPVEVQVEDPADDLAEEYVSGEQTSKQWPVGDFDQAGADTGHDQSVYEEPVETPQYFHDTAAEQEAAATEIRQRAEEEAAEIRRRAEQDADHARLRAEEDAHRASEQALALEREKAASLMQENISLKQRSLDAEHNDQSLRTEMGALEASIGRIMDQRFSQLSMQLANERSTEAETSASEEGASDELFKTLSAVEEALVAQSENLTSETANLLERYSAKFDDRLSAMRELLEARQATADAAATFALSQDKEGEPVSIAPLVEMISARLSEHRQNTKAELAALSSRIDEAIKTPESALGLRHEIAKLQRSLGQRTTGVSAPSIQLADLVRNALPPDAYELGALLSNNRKADCLVMLPHPPGPIAIDARFPIEAFHNLYEVEQKDGASDHQIQQAMNEFRRIALRHLVDIAERLIVPDQTAESALMFIPSEDLYADLQLRFPDIVQDSYRARVWIVSPTSLMATLHTVRAVLRDANTRENAALIQSEAQHVLSEVDQLRQRVNNLEENFNKARNDVRDLASSTDQVFRRAETISNTGKNMAEEALNRGSRRILNPDFTDRPPSSPGAVTTPVSPSKDEGEKSDSSDADAGSASPIDERPFPLS